jgi:methylenetetrahydrofolate reductase (NADPH)
LTDLLRARLARREWVVTVEVVTPSPEDRAARQRILALADFVRADDRIAAVTLTDRTTSPDQDPILVAPEVAARSAKSSLVHLAGKARDPDDVSRALRRAADAGISSVLLTGGDLSPQMAGVGVCDALDMLRLARVAAPRLLSLAVLAPPPRRPLDEAWARAVAKREAGAAAFVAQVTWDADQREAIATWQARLGSPVLGAVVLLTRRTLEFLADHEIHGIAIPPSLRARVETGHPDAVRRLALDLVLLHRLGYAGAHVSGLVTPLPVKAVLDEAARLETSLGDDWRGVWRDAMGIA